MHERNVINAPKEISTSARLKFSAKKENGNGIQSITKPKIIRSRRFESAPPAIMAKPKRINFFMSAKKHAKIIITHASPERLKASPGMSPRKPKAAPGL